MGDPALDPAPCYLVRVCGFTFEFWSTEHIAAALAFVLSCVGLMVFVWTQFGGTIPLTPQGYEFRASFQDAGQLATEADVR